jgi:hypothetical protein
LWLIVADLTEAGEFSIDLYTMPDTLTSKLMEHLVRDTPRGSGSSRSIMLIRGVTQGKKGLVA